MDINDSTFTCPHPTCGRHLKLRLSQKGETKDCYYVACFMTEDHPHAANFWKFFKCGEIPKRRRRLSIAASSSSVLVTSASTSSLASSSSSSSVSGSLPTISCSQNGCGSTRVHKHCTRLMCKGHCEKSGGCLTHPKPSPVLPTLLPALNDLLSSIATLPHTQLQKIITAAQQQTHELALRTPFRPSPTPSEQQEYAILVPRSPLAVSETLDFSIKHRIVLVYWATNGALAAVQAIQDPPVWRKSWPRIRLSDIGNLLKTRDHPYIDTFYECWSTGYERWMKIPVSYVHTVGTDQALFIRRVGVVGGDERRLLSKRILSVDTPTAPSKRSWKDTPTAPLKRSRNGKEKVIEADDSSEGEVEVSEVSRIDSEQPIKQEPPTPPSSRPSKRSRNDTPTAPLKRSRKGKEKAVEADDSSEGEVEVSEGKFLDGKRNRRLDHLLYILINKVLAYYALRQRRQELGFEGEDVEVKKRRDIVERSKAYVKDDICHIQDSKYIVRSNSDPIMVYEVDIDTYTCTCLDFPLISFCKHLCAVQELFGEHGPNDSEANANVLPSLSLMDGTLASTVQTASASVAIPIADGPQPPPKNVVARISEKMERLTARFRGAKKSSAISSLPTLRDLEDALDSMPQATDSDGVLPARQDLAPVVKPASARETMMPKVKVRRERAGDKAYGAGAASGSLAKKNPSKKAKTSATSSTSSRYPPPAVTLQPNASISALPGMGVFSAYVSVRLQEHSRRGIRRTLALAG
ncbi:hypothetical protein C8R47DRAFT_1323831 [Mycena vitilis]|nr:hypothetical protein C8R47DRAFT_1323831 [Mycena vitilis]